MDKHKLNYALAPIAAAMPEVMPWLEQIKSLQVHRLHVWMWPMHSFSHHRKARSASALLHLGQRTACIYSLVPGFSSLSHPLSKYSPKKYGPPGHPAEHHIGPLY